jgi:hypothetical protein
LAISCPPEIIQSAPPEHISLPSLVSWIPIPLDNGTYYHCVFAAYSPLF